MEREHSETRSSRTELGNTESPQQCRGTQSGRGLCKIDSEFAKNEPHLCWGVSSTV